MRAIGTDAKLQPKSPLDAWNDHLTLLYKEINKVPLPQTDMWVLNTSKTNFLAKWREIFDVLVEHKLWRDQLVYSYVFRDFDCLTRIKYFGFRFDENVFTGKTFPDCHNGTLVKAPM